MTRRTLVTASIPRSGNVYLVTLLSACLDGRGREGGPGAWVCPRGAACCERLPCTQKRWRPLAIVRTHDERLDFRQDADALYVVQYREPLGHFLSRAELAVEHDARFADRDAAYHAWWAATVADYAVGFLERWMAAPDPARAVIPYERLQSDPARETGALLERLGISVDAERVASSVAEQSGQRARWRVKKSEQPAYRARDTSQSDILPLRLAKAYEAHVRARTPFIAWPEPTTLLEPDAGFDALAATAHALRLAPRGTVVEATTDNPYARRFLAKHARGRGRAEP